MIKKIKAVELIPTIKDLNVFLLKLGYDIDNMLFISKQYDMSKYKKHYNTPYIISGLGVFKEVDDNCPCCVFDHRGQRVFILDPSILELIDDSFGNSVIILYETAFNESFNLEYMVDTLNQASRKGKTNKNDSNGVCL